MRDLVINRVGNGVILLFLVANLIIRVATIFYYPPYNGAIAVFVGGAIVT